MPPQKHTRTICNRFAYSFYTWEFGLQTWDLLASSGGQEVLKHWADRAEGLVPHTDAKAAREHRGRLGNLEISWMMCYLWV